MGPPDSYLSRQSEPYLPDTTFGVDCAGIQVSTFVRLAFNELGIERERKSASRLRNWIKRNGNERLILNLDSVLELLKVRSSVCNSD